MTTRINTTINTTYRVALALASTALECVLPCNTLMLLWSATVTRAVRGTDDTNFVLPICRIHQYVSKRNKGFQFTDLIRESKYNFNFMASYHTSTSFSSPSCPFFLFLHASYPYTLSLWEKVFLAKQCLVSLHFPSVS